MSYNHEYNAAMSLLSYFQNAWVYPLTAHAAFLKAKERKIASMEREIENMKNLNFDKFSRIATHNVQVNDRRAAP